MAAGIGFSFEPNADAGTAPGGSAPAFGSQSSIKTLNYQLPAQTGAVGAAGISPLVSQQRQGSGITSAVLQSVLRTVLGPDHANMILPQGDSGRADNGGGVGGSGAVDQGPSSWQGLIDSTRSPTTVVHAGSDFVPPPPQTNTLAEAPGLKQDVTPAAPQPGPGAGVPDFGGASMSRDWLTNRGGG